ncbi:hypothetical protein KW782_02160 [Candidatus Parcubacteria bacterium]|nr:hypothetical protein [Candidatus Parcubacteria bacterium]
MKYTIQRSVKKITQTGKPFIKATLKDEIGQEMDNVSIWSDFPNFESLQPGVETTGVIETSSQGFRNLKPATMQRMVQAEQQPLRNPGYDHRMEMIRRSQEKKYEAIAFFNATNSAISLVSNMKAKLMNGTVNRSTMKQEITFWRDWFIDEWKRNQGSGGKAQH